MWCRQGKQSSTADMIVNLRWHIWVLPHSSRDLKPTFCQRSRHRCSGITVCWLAGGIYRLPSNHYLMLMHSPDKNNKKYQRQHLYSEFSLTETPNKQWLGEKIVISSTIFRNLNRIVKNVKAFIFNESLHHCCLYSGHHKWRQTSWDVCCWAKPLSQKTTAHI